VRRDDGRVAGATRVGHVSAAPARVARAPFEPSTLRGLLFCLAGTGAGLAAVALLLALPFGLTVLVPHLAGAPRAAVAPAAVAGDLLGLLLLAVLAPWLGRAAATAMPALYRRLLGGAVDPAPPRRRVRLGGLGGGRGWRGVAYLLVRLPVAVLDGYALLCWAGGLANLTYPLWWRLFRNHPPGVRLSAVPVLTPLGTFGVASFAGTFAAFGAGAATLLVSPWLVRWAGAADGWLMRLLLGPGRLARRVRDLEASRAGAVDDAAERLRRVERDLHDGAQARLAALAMNLGRARERLGAGGDPADLDPADLDRARQLLDGAHRSAKDALVELRDLARGIHPPVLDNGLPDALETLASGSAVPVRLRTDIPVRPTPAIEEIAYFCAAELLANAVKHSRARTVAIEAVCRDGVLRLCVTDDGVGGADPARGSGLSGLARRVGAVDGRLQLTSPPGGPTRVTVELPPRA
jgi:signal transduction histidine kinase